MTAAEDELDAWRGTLTDRALRPYVFQVGATEANDRDAATATVLPCWRRSVRRSLRAGRATSRARSGESAGPPRRAARRGGGHVVGRGSETAGQPDPERGRCRARH